MRPLSRPRLLSLLLALGTLLGTGPAQAGPLKGGLDPTFGIRGTATITFRALAPCIPTCQTVDAYYDRAGGMALQRDGRIVVAGAGCQYLEEIGDRVCQPAFARLKPDGVLDPTFGVGGMSAPASLRGFVQGRPAVLPDGGIIGVLTPDCTNCSRSPEVARMTSTGKLDRGFGVNGVATLAFRGKLVAALAQPDGKIVAAGTESWSTPYTSVSRVRLARLLPSGAPDPTFGVGGYASLPIDRYEFLVGAALDPRTGSVLISGASLTCCFEWPAFVARLTASGASDVSFGIQGEGTLQPMEDPIVPVRTKVAVAPSGRVGVIGYRKDTSESVMQLLDPNGQRAAHFGVDGAIAPLGGSAIQDDLAFLPDGRVIILGSYRGGGGTVHLLRYDTDGSPDATFGRNGDLTFSPLFGAVPTALVLQPDTKPLVLSQVADFLSPSAPTQIQISRIAG